MEEKEYIVGGTLTIGDFKKVRAASEAAALDVARGLANPSNCHQCNCAGRNDPEAWQLSDGLSSDGVAEGEVTFEIHVVEA